MSKRYLRSEYSFLCCFLAVFCCFTAFVFADDPPKKIKGPITITSGTLTADNLARTALFEQAVIARTAHMTMYADRMLVHYDRESGNVTRIDVSGTVRVTMANRVITSRDAVYYAGEEKIIFAGEPRAVEGENVVTGTKMIYLMNEDRFLVEGSKVFLNR